MQDRLASELETSRATEATAYQHAAALQDKVTALEDAEHERAAAMERSKMEVDAALLLQVCEVGRLAHAGGRGAVLAWGRVSLVPPS